MHHVLIVCVPPYSAWHSCGNFDGTLQPDKIPMPGGFPLQLAYQNVRFAQAAPWTFAQASAAAPYDKKWQAYTVSPDPETGPLHP